MSDWEPRKWGDLATLEYGKALRGYQEAEGPYRVFGTNGPIGWHDEALCTYPSVVVGRKGAYRGIHYSDDAFWVIDTAFYLAPQVEFDMRWAYYELLTHDINSMDSGSAIPSTTRDAFYALDVLVPPLDQQSRIAHILGTLDDKIELNRRMNQTLEAIARAIFKSWFIDFEPVHAKAEGCEPVGMDPETAALFPDSFQDSPLGKIPKGWEVATVGDLGEVICGKTPRTVQPENYGAGIPFITIPDMRGAVFVTRTARELTAIGAATQPKKLLPAHTVCVSCIATAGLVALTSEPSHTNQQINSIVCKDEISPYWCYLQMQSMSREVIAGGSGGSATLNLNKREFSALPVSLPHESLQDAFHGMVDPVFGLILVAARGALCLERIRDVLLPPMLSGRLATRAPAGAEGWL